MRKNAGAYEIDVFPKPKTAVGQNAIEENGGNDKEAQSLAAHGCPCANVIPAGFGQKYLKNKKTG